MKPNLTVRVSRWLESECIKHRRVHRVNPTAENAAKLKELKARAVWQIAQIEKETHELNER